MDYVGQWVRPMVVGRFFCTRPFSVYSKFIFIIRLDKIGACYFQTVAQLEVWQSLWACDLVTAFSRSAKWRHVQFCRPLARRIKGRATLPHLSRGQLHHVTVSAVFFWESLTLRSALLLWSVANCNPMTSHPGLQRCGLWCRASKYPRICLSEWRYSFKGKLKLVQLHHVTWRHVARNEARASLPGATLTSDTAWFDVMAKATAQVYGRRVAHVTVHLMTSPSNWKFA